MAAAQGISMWKSMQSLLDNFIMTMSFTLYFKKSGLNTCTVRITLVLSAFMVPGTPLQYYCRKSKGCNYVGIWQKAPPFPFLYLLGADV